MARPRHHLPGQTAQSSGIHGGILFVGALLFLELAMVAYIPHIPPGAGHLHASRKDRAGLISFHTCAHTPTEAFVLSPHLPIDITPPSSASTSAFTSAFTSASTSAFTSACQGQRRHLQLPLFRRQNPSTPTAKQRHTSSSRKTITTSDIVLTSHLLQQSLFPSPLSLHYLLIDWINLVDSSTTLQAYIQRGSTSHAVFDAEIRNTIQVIHANLTSDVGWTSLREDMEAWQREYVYQVQGLRASLRVADELDLVHPKPNNLSDSLPGLASHRGGETTSSMVLASLNVLDDWTFRTEPALRRRFSLLLRQIEEVAPKLGLVETRLRDLERLFSMIGIVFREHVILARGEAGHDGDEGNDDENWTRDGEVLMKIGDLVRRVQREASAMVVWRITAAMGRHNAVGGGHDSCSYRLDADNNTLTPDDYDSEHDSTTLTTAPYLQLAKDEEKFLAQRAVCVAKVKRLRHQAGKAIMGRI